MSAKAFNLEHCKILLFCGVLICKFFKILQPEVRMDIEIDKPSLYRMLYRYVKLNEGTVKGTVTFNPESALDTTQRSDVVFQPSEVPDFASVGNIGFVLNPGRWTVAIQTDDSVFLVRHS